MRGAWRPLFYYELKCPLLCTCAALVYFLIVPLPLQLYNYIKQYNPKTKIMASGIRTKEDALALCGIDYLVMPSKVELELAATPTAAGYNDGLHALESGDEGTAAALSIETAQESGINQVSC